MNDVMIDFEALGKDCPCQIGAIYFDRVTGELGKPFKANIDSTTLLAQPDAKTVYWWLQQNKEAQNTLLTDKQHINHVLTDLVEFLKDAKRIWSHATYDFVMLQNILTQYQIPNNISYKSGLDIGTLVYLAGISIKDIVREGIHHDALEDCKYQVKYVTKALNELKLNKNIINFINKVSSD
jgi:hypothetical protein